MWNFLSNMSNETVKGFLVILMTVSICVGFFMKLVPPEVFTSFVATIITYYYKDNESKTLQKRLDDSMNELKTYRINPTK